MPAAIIQKKNYYQLLDLPNDTSEEAIRVAYKKLALKWHPDRNHDDKENAQQKFVEINEAYNALLDGLHSRRDKHRHEKAEGSRSSWSSTTSTSTSEGGNHAQPDPSSKASSQSPKVTKERQETDHPAEGETLNRPHSNPTKSMHSKSSRNSKHSHKESPFSHLRSDWSSDEDEDDSISRKSKSPYKKARHVEEDGYEFVDLGSPLRPLCAPKLSGTISKDWIFPLPLSLDDLYHGASHHYRITRTLRSGKTQSVKIDIKVSPGWRKGTRVRVPGVGNERKDGAFQDIVFVVEEQPHPHFTRVNDDLLISVQVPWADSLPRPYPSTVSDAGSSAASESDMAVRDELAFVKGLNGEEFALSIPRSLVEGADGTRIVGAGMPIRKHGQTVGKGDLVVRWDFVFPETEKAQRTRWQSLRKAMNWKL